MPTELPAIYGKVSETDEEYVLMKRVDLAPAFAVPFKGITVIMGYNPDDGRFYIHSLMYPKEEYKREDVEKIARKTSECPYCIHGSKIIPTEKLVEYIKENFPYLLERGSKSRVIEIKAEEVGGEKLPITSPWASMVGMPGGNMNFDDFVFNGLGTALLGAGIDLVSPNELARRIIKGVTGALCVGIPLIPQINPFIPNNVKKHSTLTGMNLIFQAIDPTPAQIKEMVEVGRRFRNALLGFGPLGAIKELFRPTGGSVYSYFGGINLPKINLPSPQLSGGTPALGEETGVFKKPVIEPTTDKIPIIERK